jgi:ABC-type multidrug transport system fused ATPase/permease subunit
MIYKLFYVFFKQHMFLFIVYLLTLFYLPISKLGMPHVYGKLISKLKSAKLDNSLYYFTILIILWSFIQGLITISTQVKANLLPKFTAFVRVELVNTIINKYKTNYEDLELGNTITKIIKSPWLLEDIFRIAEDFIFRNVIIIITSFFYLFFYNKKLALIYLLCMGVILIMCYLFSKSCTKYSTITDNTYDEVHEEIEDTLSNLISIYTSQKIKYEKDNIKKISDKIFKTERDFIKCNNKYRLVFTFIFVLIFIILNAYSYYLFKTNLLKLESLISIIIINYTLLSSFMTIYNETKYYIDIMGRMEVFNNYINNLPNSSKDNILEIKKPDNLIIKFENTTFYYIKDKYILQNFNLTINNNDIIALIGGIGSGKSTIAKLLIRLKDYNSGKIIISKYEINKLNIDNLRNIINYIPQHPKLFNRTLFHNISYGVKRTIEEKEIYDILDKLNVKETTDIFKKIMYKPVGKNGSNLSGGQRQIVWLIRAVLKDSKVIILDEPTASLDQKSKIQIIEFIKAFCKNKILILITHDMDLLKYVNRIIKLDKGTIISDKKQ